MKTMTWLSDRSGIASIGVDVSAHHPQPARLTQLSWSDSAYPRVDSLLSVRTCAIKSPSGSTPSSPRCTAATLLLL